MALTPQAPRYTDEELRQLVHKVRTMLPPEQSAQFANKTDYEILTHLRRHGKGYETIPLDLPSDITKAHLDAKDPNREDLFYRNPQINVDDQLTVSKDRTIAGSIMGGGGIVDAFPKWLGDAVKSGANESVMGYAIQIGTGDAPFRSPWNDQNEPNMWQSALGIGAMMAYDMPFFWATKGLGIVPHLAGSGAKKESAKFVARHLFRDGAVDNAAKLGIEKYAGKELTEVVTKAVAGKGIKKGSEKLAKLGADEALVQSLKETSKTTAKNYVQKAINNPTFLKDDIIEVAGYTLKEPIQSAKLRTLANHFGMRSAQALGMYNIALDVEGQAVEAISKRIDPETGNPYEYGKAQNILERWKAGEPGLTGADWEWDVERTMWSGAHGLVGGYFAGALSGIMRAGQAGAFAEGNFEKYLAKSHPAIEKHLYSHFVGIPLEAGGFTSAGYLLESMGDKSQLGIPLSERFVHNLVTIGTLKGMHGTFDIIRKNKDRLEDSLYRSILDRNLAKKEAIQKARDQLDLDTEAGRTVDKTLKDEGAKADKTFEKQSTALKVLFGDIGAIVRKKVKGAVTLKGELTKQKGRAFDSEGNPLVTVEELNQIKTLVKEILDLKRIAVENKIAVPEEVQRLAEDPLVVHFEKLIKKDGSLDGVFNKLEQEILKAGSKKRKQSVEETEEESRRKIEEDERISIEEEVGKDFIHKDKLTPEQLKDATPHAMYTDYVRKPPVTEKPVESGVAVKIKELKEQTADDISTQNKAEINKVKTGNKKVDADNKEVIELIARAKKLKGEGDNAEPTKSAHNFSKWFFKKTGKSIKEATWVDLQKYLDTGGDFSGKGIVDGKPFGSKAGTQQRVFSTNDAKRRRIRAWAKELVGVEGTGFQKAGTLKRSPIEKLKRTEIENVRIREELEKSGRSREAMTPEEIVEFNKKVKDIIDKGDSIPLGSKKNPVYISVETVALINFMRNVHGLRSTTLKNQYFGSEDIALDSKGNLSIQVIDKQVKGEAKIYSLNVPKGKIGGVDYYQLIIDGFIGKGVPGKHALRDVSGNQLKQSHIIELNKLFGGGHSRVRKGIYKIAAEMDRLQVKNNDGTYTTEQWSVLAKMLESHKMTTTEADIARSVYGMGQTYKEAYFSDMKQLFEYAPILLKKRSGKKPESKKQIFLGLDEGSKKQKNELTNNAPLAKEMLEKQVRELIKKYPGLKVKLSKKGEHAGEIENSLIKLVIGKADATTFFHETTHALEGVIRATKNKELINLWERGEGLVEAWAEKHDPNRWKKFLKEYGERAENEYLTQLTSEMALEKFKANTRIGKFGVWIKEFVSAFKNFFGFGSAKDISRQFGKMVEEGFDARVPIRVEKYQKTTVEKEVLNDKAPEYESIKELQNKKGLQSLEILVSLGLWDLNNPTVGKNIYVDKYGNFSGLNRGQANAIIDFLSRNFPDKKPGKSSTWLALNKKAHALEVQNGITKKYAKMLKRMVGINFGTLSNANEAQLKRYIEVIRNFGKEYPKETALIDEAFAEELASKDSQFSQIRKSISKMALPVSSVLRKMGATKVAAKLEDHYLTEARHVGESMVFISRATRFAGKKNLKYLPYALDPAMAKNNPLAPEGLDSFLKKVSVTGSKEGRAVQEMKDMYSYFWKALILQGKEKIKNPRIREDWLETMQEKHIQQYFTRRLTDKAKEHLRIGSKGHEEAVNKLVQDITLIRTNDISKRIDKLTKQIDEIPVKNKVRKDYEKQLDEQRKLLQDIRDNENNPNAETYKSIRKEADDQLLMLMRMQKNVVENKFLLSRLPRLDNFMLDQQGKKFKVYDDSFESVIGHYTRVMSKYLATVEHFNEYTNVRSDYTFSSGTSSEILEQIGKKTEFGQYLERAVNRRLGMEKADLEGQWFTNGLTKVSKYSALYGLSSPFSGLKNLAIGTSLTVGVHGSRAFLHGFAKLFSADAWSIARQKGWLEIGTKEVEIRGLGAKWMKWFSWMTPTEAINRVAGGFAGEFNARQLVASMRGEGYSLLRLRPMRAKIQLAKLFNLSKKELDFLEDFGMDKNKIAFGGKNENYIAETMEAITDKIQHYGHIKSQGATGDPFLPLWAGNPNARAATLFYRMAYSGTANIINHVVEPALNGNPLPLARYAFTGNLAGKALWSVYEKILGKEPPKINEDEMAQLTANLAKAEALGLFSFVLNPYKVPGKHFGNLLLTDSIMQPAIIRNSYIVGENAWNILFSNKEINAKDTFKKGVKDIVVAFNHAGKALSKKNTPFKTDINNIRSFKNTWLKSTGRWAEQQREARKFDQGWTNEAPYYNLIRDAFLTNDLNSAARYYVATWYYLYDSKRVMNGYEQYNAKRAEQSTNSSLEGMLDSVNPLIFADPIKSGNLTKEREAFLSYLNVKNRSVANNIDKTYWFRRRQLNKNIKSLWNKYGTMYRAGYVEKLFPIPPNNYLGSAKWKVTDTKASEFGKP